MFGDMRFPKALSTGASLVVVAIGATTYAHASDAARDIADRFVAGGERVEAPSREGSPAEDTGLPDVDHTLAPSDLASENLGTDLAPPDGGESDRPGNDGASGDTARRRLEAAHRARLDRILSKLSSRILEFELRKAKEGEIATAQDDATGEASPRDEMRDDASHAPNAIAERGRRPSPAERAAKTRDVGGRRAERYLFGPEDGAGADQPIIRRVTVLLEMRPSRQGLGGARRWGDPVLCLGQRCFVSTGASTPALGMARRKVLGTLNTLGKRAGACRRQLACVFRDIDLGGEAAVVQPIDLRWLRHNRREMTKVSADQTCHVAGRQTLACSHVYQSETYRLWVVPETVAESLTPEALLKALHSGLKRRTLDG